MSTPTGPPTMMEPDAALVTTPPESNSTPPAKNPVPVAGIVPELTTDPAALSMMMPAWLPEISAEPRW